MFRIFLFATVILIMASCKQKAGDEKPPYVTPFVDSTYARQKVQEFIKGQILFSKNCTGCHFPPEKHACDQHAFANLFEKLPVPSEEYFAKYIREGLALRKSGDKYSNELYVKYNRMFDHAFNELSQNDIDQLIVYIRVANKANEHGRILIKNK